MGCKQTIPFHEVQVQVLSVCAPDGFILEQQVTQSVVVIVQDTIKRRQLRGQGFCRTVEIHKDEIVPDLCVELWQVALGRIKGLDLLHQRGSFQHTITFVSPCMVGAYKTATVRAGFLLNQGAAVPTHVG